MDIGRRCVGDGCLLPAARAARARLELEYPQSKCWRHRFTAPARALFCCIFLPCRCGPPHLLPPLAGIASRSVGVIVQASARRIVGVGMGDVGGGGASRGRHRRSSVSASSASNGDGIIMAAFVRVKCQHHHRHRRAKQWRHQSSKISGVGALQHQA